MYKYIKIAPNFHILLNKTEHYRTEINLSFSSGGAFFESENERGLTHLLEHCEIKKTKEFNKSELSNYLFEKDIYRNASTSVLMKDISISGHRDYFNEMLELIFKFGFEPVISQEILDAERQIVLREMIQYKGDPNYKLWKLIGESMFKPGSRDLIEVMGDEKTVENCTLEDLYKIHKRILETNHFLLSVVGGNVDEEKITNLAKKYIKNLPSDKTHSIDENADNILQDFKYKAIVSELAHENCALSLIIPISINYKNRSIRDIISEILFYYPEGILYKTLREELQLVYSVDYYFDMSLQILRINLVGEIHNAQKLIDETIKILQKPENFISEEKLKIIKNLYIKRQEIASDNPSTQTDFVISTLLNYGIEQSYEDYLKELKEITFEEIMAYAKELKNNLENAKVVVVSKDKEIEKLELKY